LRGEAGTARVVAGRYRLAARIGSGGMGQVFRARDQVLGRTVALKVLPEELAARPGFVERFRAEAKAAARLSHPNVVQVHDWGASDGSYYMVMEYVRGRTLREVLAARGRLPPAQAAAIIGRLLAALGSAHDSGLVHRDVKPENVLVTTGGDVKVADFGIARIAEGASVTSGEMLGTASYAAPEQIRGEAVDGRTDLYAAGCVLYELVCGSPPFEGSVAHVLHEHLSARVPGPSVEVPETAPLDQVVTTATDPDPARRYPSAGAMRVDLEEAARHLPEAPPLTELAAELTSEVAAEAQETLMGPPRRRRRRWPLVLAALLALVLGSAAVLVRPVPRVTGRSRADAVARLRGAGLHASVHAAFSDTVAAGLVMAARPPLGPVGLRGSRVALTVSKGPDVRQVPNVVGWLLADAVRAIRDARLPDPQVTQTYSQGKVGTVVDQDPKPEAVRPGTPVNLTVSRGPEMVTVPAVTQTTYAQAQATLQKSGLAAGRQEVDNDAAPETVLVQSPAPGTSVPKGSAVALTVSIGPPPFPMPNMQGMTCAAARAQLESAGLAVTVTSRSGGCSSNQVLLQDPLSGTPVRKGSPATLYVP
jgi:serine/threonine-protein kinase